MANKTEEARINKASRNLQQIYRSAFSSNLEPVWNEATREYRDAWRKIIVTLEAQEVKDQYRVVVVGNKLNLYHLRLLAPRGNEIIMAGEIRSDHAGALETAYNVALGARRGFKVLDIFEGKK